MGRSVKWWLLCLVLVGCSAGDRPLQFNLGGQAIQLDWNRSIDTTSAVILDNIMEGLTSYADSLDGVGADLLRPMPALAFSWSISDGGKVYVFHLRSGVFWSDGVELEARHFVDSWRRLLDPATGSASSYELLDVENAAAFASGKLKDFSQVGVKALDPHTLEVRLRRPVPYFLHLVASASTFPIRLDLIERYGDHWMDPEHLVTLGPYRLAQWNQGDQIVLRAYPGYYGTHPKINTVICRLITEPLTAYAFYENEALDIIPHDLPSSYMRGLQGHVDYRSGPKLGVSYLLFNVHRPPFDQAANRRAFVRALNREQLAAFFEGAQTPFSGWIPPGLVGYDGHVGLAAEGRAGSEMRGRKVVLQFAGGDTWNLVFQAIQRSLAEKLGLQAKIEPIENREMVKLLAELSSPRRPHFETLPHAMLLGWVADYPDPHSFMNVFTSASENNYMGWKNARYDSLVEKAISTADEGNRGRLYLEAQKLLLEDEAVLMPLFLNSHQALVRSSLRGVNLNVLDKWYFKNVEFTESGWRSLGGSLWRRLQRRRGLAPGRS